MKKSRLFRRYALLITLTVCGLLVTVGIIDVTQSWEDNVGRAEQLLKERSRGLAVRIEEHLAGIEGQVRSVLRMPWSEGVLTRDDREFEFRRLQSVVPSITELRSYDPSRGSWLRVSQLGADETDAKAAGDQAIPSAAEGKVVYGNAVFRNGVDPYAWMAIGEKSGQTSALVNMKFVSDFISPLRFGATGRAFIVDGAGFVIAHPDLRVTLRRINLADHPTLAGGLGHSAGQAFEALSLDGRRVFVAAQPIGRTGWSVFAEQSADEVLQPVRTAAYRAIGTILAGVLVAIALALLLAGKMSAPIVRLRETAARIGTGHFEARTQVRTDDEVEDLADELNRMAQRLQGFYAELEAKVRERTRELAQRREEADQANSAKTRFLAAASHDLRQPMHAVGLLVGILEQRLDREDLRALAAKARMSVESMEGLFTALLDISKLDAGAVKPEVRAVELAPLLQTIEMQFASGAREKGLGFSIGKCPWWVRTDPLLLLRILGNLVANAIRYTSEGHVRIGCRRRGSSLQLMVVDTGPGIPAEYRKEIFSEFFQVPGVDRQGSAGLGLGLSIVQRSADLLGHRLAVRSWPARGSVFTVELPIADHPRMEAAAVAHDSSSPLDGAFVVVMDDDADNCFATQAWFSAWGCHVVAGTSSDDVCAKLEGHLRPPDLIVSDLRLAAGETGETAIVRIRGMSEASIPALIVTGDLTRSALGDSMPRVRIVHKPLSAESLRAAAEALLRSVSPRSEA